MADLRRHFALPCGTLPHVSMKQLDAVWNRAALDNGGAAARSGDRALAALLVAHGLVMNGGVAHAVEVLSTDDFRAAVEGFRFFGFHELTNLLQQAASGAVDETNADERYAAVIPTDSTLFDRFVAIYATSPSLFARV